MACGPIFVRTVARANHPGTTIFRNDPSLQSLLIGYPNGINRLTAACMPDGRAQGGAKSAGQGIGRRHNPLEYGSVRAMHIRARQTDDRQYLN